MRGFVREKLAPRIVTERHKSLRKIIVPCLPPASYLSLLLALFHPVAYFTGVHDQKLTAERTEPSVSWALIQSQITKETHILNYRMFSLSLSLLISLSLFHSLPFLYIIFPSSYFFVYSATASSLSCILYGSVSNDRNVA